MRIDELFPPEVIDEDIKKMVGGAVLGAALLASPFNSGHRPDDVIHHTGPSFEDIKIMANTMWGEARNLGVQGMNAIGHVIKNRADVHAPHFGNGIKGVALKPKQFSCWNPSDPNRSEMSEMQKIENYFKTKQPPPGEKSFDDWVKKFKNSPQYPEYRAWLEAYELAKDILSNKSTDPTNGALFYHTKGVHPSWSKGVKPITADANHIFYKTARIDNSKK